MNLRARNIADAQFLHSLDYLVKLCRIQHIFIRTLVSKGFDAFRDKVEAHLLVDVSELKQFGNVEAL
jgi:hypothetical protein